MLIDTFGGLAGEARAVREAHAAWRRAAADLAAEEARIAKARGDADYLRHAHAELDKLAVEPGEEESSPGRRAAMMQAEKVAGDLRDAQETLVGDHAPIGALAAAAAAPRAACRPGAGAGRTERQGARCRDRSAGRRRPDARRGGAQCRFRSARARARRRTPVRAARLPRANMRSPVEALPALAQSVRARSRGARCRRGAARRAGASGAARRSSAMWLPRRRSRPAASGRPASSTRRSTANCAPLKLERARFITADRHRSEPRRARRHRPGGVLGADQSGHAAGPVDEGRLGRRARPFHAGPQGGARRSRLGADPGLRRDRHRRRRRRRRCDRPAARAARDATCRCSPSPMRRRSRRARAAISASPRTPWRRAGASPRASRSWKRESRREEIARMLAGATITDEARAAAGRLIEGAG